MMKKLGNSTKSKISVLGLIVTLGIVYGDIGTSPLYVMSAMIRINGNLVERDYVLGAISLIIWTLILITTIKYVILMLRADNNSEGGVLSLYTLVKKHYPKLIIVACIGSAALLADSIITPAITVTSAIEGLNIITSIDKQTILLTAIIIVALLFFFQHYGTVVLGRTFGVIMFVWFGILAFLGLYGISSDLSVLHALNPYYGLKLLISSPIGLVILGAVFLCTTGAEALYSDMGHTGRKNIYYTWVYVKIALVLNYLGQGAVLLQHTGDKVYQNPFFLIMPNWMVFPGIILATMAAIIASQSLISGATTLVSEAIKLEQFPRLVINYPAQLKGQVYIPAVNTWMCFACIGILLIFQESANMEAAYGLAITIAMLMTTILYFFYLKMKQVNPILRYLFITVYLIIEGIFLISNVLKIPHGGYVVLIIGSFIMALMYIWIKGRQISAAAANREKIQKYVKNIELLQQDPDVPFLCTNLIYLTQSAKDNMVEKKIIYSLLNRGSKKAKVYWFVNVNVTDEPYTMEYSVDTIKAKTVFKIHLHLGFKVKRNLDIYIRYVIRDMMKKGELNKVNLKYRIKNTQGDEMGDVRYIMINETLSDNSSLTPFEVSIIKMKLLIKKYTISPARWFGIDSSNLEIENLPLLVNRDKSPKLKRVDKN